MNKYRWDYNQPLAVDSLSVCIRMCVCVNFACCLVAFQNLVDENKVSTYDGLTSISLQHHNIDPMSNTSRTIYMPIFTHFAVSTT